GEARGGEGRAAAATAEESRNRPFQRSKKAPQENRRRNLRARSAHRRRGARARAERSAPLPRRGLSQRRTDEKNPAAEQRSESDDRPAVRQVGNAGEGKGRARPFGGD